MSAADPGAGARPRDDLRRRAARGTLINAAFLVGLNLLALIKGFVVAAFLEVGDYGLWGLLALSVSMVMILLQAGIGDKYVQQDGDDQEAAFQAAFTLQCLVCLIFMVVVAAAMPVFALLFDEPDVLLPGWILALAVPGMALQSPLWTYYRRMDFLTQRRLQAVDPIVGFVVTVAAAAAGAGYWALVAGVIAGAWAGALVAVRASPYPLRLRYEASTMREYRRFSGPLLLASLSGSMIGFVPVLVAQRHLGLVAVGALAVASNISIYTARIDEIVTNTLYPAICAVKDRRDLMLEAFLKSNRLAMLWAFPAGCGIVLFAPDLVEHVLGGRWEVATYVIQAFGLAAALNQVGFNWTAFYRALGRTRPIGVATAVMLVAVLGLGIPMLLAEGVDGYGTAMVPAIACLVAVRLFYLSRLFPLGAIARNVGRAILPTLPALALVLAARYGVGNDDRGGLEALAEVTLFAAVVAAGSLVAERALLGEVRAYLRPPGAAPA